MASNDIGSNKPGGTSATTNQPLKVDLKQLKDLTKPGKNDTGEIEVLLIVPDDIFSNSHDIHVNARGTQVLIDLHDSRVNQGLGIKTIPHPPPPPLEIAKVKVGDVTVKVKLGLPNVS